MRSRGIMIGSHSYRCLEGGLLVKSLALSGCNLGLELEGVRVSYQPGN